jgi:hypothetical protein
MTEPLTVVVWKWRVPDRPAEFKPEYVNILRASFARHYREPHRFVCVTDEPEGLECETMPCPVVTLPHSRLGAPKGVRFPSSYRRLWNFSAEAKDAFGPRILALDIDVIVTGDLRPVLNRSEDFVTWWDPTHKWGKVPGGIYLHRTGTLTCLWDEFDPAKTPKLVANSNCPSPVGTSLCRGSDQGWMSYRLLACHDWKAGPHPLPHWTRADGVYSMKWLMGQQRLPGAVKIISTPGFDKPWTPSLQRRHPWIAEHWRA